MSFAATLGSRDHSCQHALVQMPTSVGVTSRNTRKHQLRVGACVPLLELAAADIRGRMKPLRWQFLEKLCFEAV